VIIERVVNDPCLSDEELGEFIKLWKKWTEFAFQEHQLSKAHPVIVPLNVLRLADRAIGELCLFREQQAIYDEWSALDREMK
jgi:hypothetical protein